MVEQPPAPEPEVLSVRELLFVTEYALGKTQTEAARKAGFRAKNASSKLMRNPVIVAAIEAEKVRIRERTNYSVERAMAELDDSLAMATQMRDASGRNRAIELKMKLNGLLVDRHVDLTAGLDLAAALAAAKLRVTEGVNLPRDQALLPAESADVSPSAVASK